MRAGNKPGTAAWLQDALLFCSSVLLLAEGLVNVPQPPLGFGLRDATICYDYQGCDAGNLAGISTLLMRKAGSTTLRPFPSAEPEDGGPGLQHPPWVSHMEC